MHSDVLDSTYSALVSLVPDHLGRCPRLILLRTVGASERRNTSQKPARLRKRESDSSLSNVQYHHGNAVDNRQIASPVRR